MRPPARRRPAPGFGLIELMIGLVLGLLVTVAAIGIFSSNRQAYRSTEGLSRIQEGARTAFELIARDLRVAGGSACTRRSLTNALTAGTGTWWGSFASWDAALTGYAATAAFPDATPAFGTAAGARLAGTAALQVFSGSDYVASVSADSGTAFTLNSSLHDFVSGDVLVACDTNTATVFATTAVNGTQVAHPSTLSYGANAALARLGATRWYVGYNATGGTSLYRRRLYAGALRTEEVAADVSDLQLAYLLSGASSYVAAAAVGSAWSSVTAVRVTLTLGSPEKVGTDGQVLQRTLVSVIGLRNRDG